MSPYSQEQIEEKFQTLPQTLKDAMISVENSEHIFEVGKRFALTIEQIGMLAEETGYVVLGLTHPKDFVDRMAQHLRIDQAKAKVIAQAINSQVFLPLREMLKDAHQFDITQDQIKKPPMPIPPVSRFQPPSPLIPSPPTPIKPSIPLPPVPPSPSPIPPKPSPIPAIPSAPLRSTPPPITTQPPANFEPVLRPLSPLPPSTIEEGRGGPPVKPSPMPSSAKPAEYIRTKEPAPAPSQVMQNKLLEEKKHASSGTKSDVERMKESLFAPASVPNPPSTETKPTPPSNAQPKTALPQSPQPPKPTSYSGTDPYREPLE